MEPVALQPATGALSIDGTGLVAVPGLIDSHVHLHLDAGPDPRNVYIESRPEVRSAAARRNAHDALSVGITTVQDLGCSVDDVERFVHADDDLPQPTVLWSGPPMTREAGHCHFWGGEVAGPRDVARLVDRVAATGARTLKLMASGGGLTPGTSPARLELPEEYIRVAVAAARQVGLRVTAHCHATSAIRAVVDAGVSMIEHVGFLGDDGVVRFDPELALRIRDSGIHVGPTVISALRTADRYRREGRPSNLQDGTAIDRLEARRRNAAHFFDLDLEVVAGSDAGVTDTHFGSLIDEVLVYAGLGASPLQALRTATTGAARALGLSGKGAILPGMDADIILVRGDPLVDIDAIKAVDTVIHAGQEAA